MQTQYELKQYKKGLKAADTILKKYPNHGGAWYLLSTPSSGYPFLMHNRRNPRLESSHPPLVSALSPHNVLSP